MAYSIIVGLNKPTREFQAGGNIGFSIHASVQYHDHQTKRREWTNYSAIVLARPGMQADCYRSVLVEGGIVEVTGKNIRVDIHQGQNGQSITLESLNVKIGFTASGGNQQQQSSNHQDHPEYGDSIPF